MSDDEKLAICLSCINYRRPKRLVEKIIGPKEPHCFVDQQPIALHVSTGVCPLARYAVPPASAPEALPAPIAAPAPKARAGCGKCSRAKREQGGK